MADNTALANLFVGYLLSGQNPAELKTHIETGGVEDEFEAEVLTVDATNGFRLLTITGSMRAALASDEKTDVVALIASDPSLDSTGIEDARLAEYGTWIVTGLKAQAATAAATGTAPPTPPIVQPSPSPAPNNRTTPPPTLLPVSTLPTTTTTAALVPSAGRRQVRLPIRSDEPISGAGGGGWGVPPVQIRGDNASVTFNLYHGGTGGVNAPAPTQQQIPVNVKKWWWVLPLTIAVSTLMVAGILLATVW